MLSAQVELLTEALQSAGHSVQLAVTVPTQGNKSRKMLEHLHHKFILAKVQCWSIAALRLSAA